MSSLYDPEFEVQPCTGGSWSVPGTNRVCQKCRPYTACDKFPGDFQVQGCTEVRDIICLSEVNCTCNWPHEYIALPCNVDRTRGEIRNATCAKISGRNCTTWGFYKEADPTPTSDIVCNMCPTSCPDGYFQSTNILPTSKFFGSCPFDCQACSTCGPGSYENASCTATRDTVCITPCPLCPQDSYQKEICSGKMNTKCRDCSSAPYGMYIPVENKCTAFNDSRPVPCKYHLGDPSRPCPAGHYIEKSCNRQCVCPSAFDSSCNGTATLFVPTFAFSTCTGFHIYRNLRFSGRRKRSGHSLLHPKIVSLPLSRSREEQGAAPYDARSRFLFLARR